MHFAIFLEVKGVLVDYRCKVQSNGCNVLLKIVKIMKSTTVLKVCIQSSEQVRKM